MTETPTPTNTSQQVQLSPLELEFLNFLEQYWFEAGAIPTAERCSELGLDSEFVTACFRKAEFRHALLERGVSLRGLPETVLYGEDGKPKNPPVAEWRKMMLSEEQLAVANTLLDGTDTRSEKKKLTDLGVSTAKYQSWLRDPAFQHYIRQRSEGALQDNQHVAHMALIDRVKSGDTNAIKYYNELTGRFVPAIAKNTGGADIGTILIQVLEVIQKFVQDQTIQSLMADELLKISDAHLSSSSNASPRVIEAAPYIPPTLPADPVGAQNKPPVPLPIEQPSAPAPPHVSGV